MIVLPDWGQALDQIIVYFISGRQQSYRKSLSKITGNFGKLSQKCVQEESAKWRARVLYVLGMLREMACFKKLE